MNRKPITIYALLNGSTSSSARKLIAEGQRNAQETRAAERPKTQPSKHKGKKRRTGR